jgi:ribonuclease D
MPEWIDRPEELPALWEHLSNADLIAIDTESDQMHAYRPALCLLQIATRHREVVLDPLNMPEGALTPLSACLAAPTTVKIIHAADNDMRLLQRQFGFRVNNLFDTQEAARFLNHTRTGLASLLDHYLNIAHNKKFQQTNWRYRPLHPDAIEYAGMDVRHLIELRSRLIDALEERCLTVPFTQNCEAMTRRDYDPSASFNIEHFRKMRGAKDIRGRSRALLRALYGWRHTVCERINRSPFMVIEDYLLMEIATKKPRNLEALEAIKRLSNAVIRRYGRAIIEVIEREWDAPVPPARMPGEQGRGWKGPQGEGEGRALSMLLDWRAEVAELEGLEGALIASKRVLERLAKERPRDMESLLCVCAGDWLPWQVERYGEDVLHIVK